MTLQKAAVQLAESPADHFYRTVWRWHFYAGLFVIPFLLMLSITGSIYLFKPQLDVVMYHHQLFVQPAQAIMPYSQQLGEVQQAYAGAKITKFIPGIAPNRSTEVTLTTAQQEHLLVFVNPYTGKILGDRSEDYNFQAIVRKMHSELMLGQVGNYLVELAACWGLVLLMSGLYLWWPRDRFSIGGTLIPRVWHQNRRVFWRDLHSVSGFYGILLIGFLILTGLPWSGFWGHTFSQIWNHFPNHVFSDPPHSTAFTGTLNQRGGQTVPWAVEPLPMPTSDCHAGHGQEDSLKDKVQLQQAGDGTTPPTIDSIVDLAEQRRIAPGYSVSLPQEKTGVFTVSVFPEDPTEERTIHIDRYSGRILADVSWQDYSLVARGVEMGIAIHMGRYWGLPNQLIILVGCLSAMAVCVSAVILWWQRRPSGRIGAPTLPPFIQAWRVPLWIVAILGLVFPLVGFSLLIVLLLDYWVISRLPLLKRLLT
jgi:uncharacterized iron-regulated membrane protein